MKQDLFIELGTEEIPARFIAEGERNFGEELTAWLKAQRITYDAFETFSTPRRLAVWVKGVAVKQEDQSAEVRGPASRIAQTEDGSWSKAAHGFARKQGIDVTQLALKEYKGDLYVFAQKREIGAETNDLLEKGLHQVFSSISFPTTMRWGEGHRFIRPVRWIVCLFGERVIPLTWAGVQADRISQGHRFLGSEIEVQSPETYQAQLQDAFVMVSAVERRESIINQLKDLEQKNQWQIPIDPALLEEVTNLVEYPTVLNGTFDVDFLTLPKAVLITTMREHQRYFPVEDGNQHLLPYFITVRNGDHRHLELVSKGNEKVLEARLADARFFYQEDVKRPIDDAVKQLDRIVFRQELGSMGDRVRRIRVLSTLIGDEMACDAEMMQVIDRAATICKFDLVTQMVDEFSNLEGIMGYEYASVAGEEERVAKAIQDHVHPRYAGDDLPTSQVGAILSLADKMDMIASCFGIGIIPTGSQDPYSLRRKALGILQILLVYPTLSFEKICQASVVQLEKEGLLKLKTVKVEQELRKFFAARFRSILQEEQIRYDLTDSLLTVKIAYPALVVEKARVLMEQVEQEGFKEEVEGYTRVAHLAFANQPESTLDENGLVEDAEKALYTAYQESQTVFDHARVAQDPDKMYQALQHLAPVIHRFFDEVMVMSEDQSLRQNRLALLQHITELTAEFADFRKIVFP